jgi:hypothetical protein
LRISADSRGRKFQADETFAKVDEALQEEVYLHNDGNWYSARNVFARKAFIFVDGAKMKKPNSLGECKSSIDSFCRNTLGSVFMP